MFSSGPRLSERLSPYQCFTQPGFAQPAAPSQRTQLLSLFWPASHCTPQELNVYQCFALSRAIAQELIFSHCFSEPSATYEERSIYHFFGLQSFQPTSTQLFSMFCWNRDSHNVGAPTIKEGSTLLAIARPNIFRRRHFVPNLQLATCNLQSARSP